VELTQNRNEPLLVRDLFLGSECGARAEFFEDIVHVREGQAGVLGLLPFAMGVESFGQFADSGLLSFSR
jgi:hypothetical protein